MPTADSLVCWGRGPKTAMTMIRENERMIVCVELDVRNKRAYALVMFEGRVLYDSSQTINPGSGSARRSLTAVLRGGPSREQFQLRPPRKMEDHRMGALV